MSEMKLIQIWILAGAAVAAPAAEAPKAEEKKKVEEEESDDDMGFGKLIRYFSILILSMIIE